MVFSSRSRVSAIGASRSCIRRVSALEVGITRIDQVENRPYQRRSRRCRKSHQHDANHGAAGREHEATEVLVFGQHHSILESSRLEHDAIRCSRRGLSDGLNVVPRGTQRPNDRCVAGLVRQKAHGSRVLCPVLERPRVLLTDGVGSVGDGGPDVLWRDLRIGVGDELPWGCPAMPTLVPVY